MTLYTLWPSTDGPATVSTDDSVSLSTEFYVTSTAWVTALRFWRADTTVSGAIVGAVYDVGSGTAVTGTDVTFAVSGTGWLQADMASPVALTTNTRYRAVVLYPHNYSATLDYWSSGDGSAGITNGPLTAPSSGGGPTQSSFQGAFGYGATITFPNGQFRASCYWVDVVVSDTITTNAPAEQVALTVNGQDGAPAVAPAVVDAQVTATGLDVVAGVMAPATDASATVGMSDASPGVDTTPQGAPADVAAIDGAPWVAPGPVDVVVTVEAPDATVTTTDGGDASAGASTAAWGVSAVDATVTTGVAPAEAVLGVASDVITAALAALPTHAATTVSAGEISSGQRGGSMDFTDRAVSDMACIDRNQATMTGA